MLLPAAAPALPQDQQGFAVAAFDVINAAAFSHGIAFITAPSDGAAVAQTVAVKGTLLSLAPGQRAFLLMRSTAFGRRYFPAQEIMPDATGHWAMDAQYATAGYTYETFVAATQNTASAQALSDQTNRVNGLTALPDETAIISPVIRVRRR